MKLRISVAIFIITIMASSANAVTASGQYCTGNIQEVLKWSSHEKMSILIEGTKRYFQVPGKIEESMALIAYSTGKPLKILWSSEAVTIDDCIDDWPQYKVLDGFMVID